MILLTLFVAFASQAAPVPFKEGIAFTSLNQGFHNDQSAAYAYHRRAAVALRTMSFDDGKGDMRYYGLQLNYLAKRWNGDGYQANVYLSGGVGPMVQKRHEHSAIQNGIDLDAETRYLYAASKIEKMWTGYGSEFWLWRSRLGFAPYAAEFHQLATWIMVQYEESPYLRGYYRTTPLLRLFYRNYLLEAGVSNRGEGMLNFTMQI